MAYPDCYMIRTPTVSLYIVLGNIIHRISFSIHVSVKQLRLSVEKPKVVARTSDNRKLNDHYVAVSQDNDF